MRTKLVGDTPYEKNIIEHIEKEASDALVEKINAGEKTMRDCMVYIREEAKKEAKDGCAIIADIAVYGWAMHYFEEDSIKPNFVSGPVRTVSTERPKVEKPSAGSRPEKKPEKNDGQLDGQMNLMDFLGV